MDADIRYCRTVRAKKLVLQVSSNLNLDLFSSAGNPFKEVTQIVSCAQTVHEKQQQNADNPADDPVERTADVNWSESRLCTLRSRMPYPPKIQLGSGTKLH